MSRFAHKRVVITGAGSGLGLALALRYGRAGFRVGLLDRDQAALDRAVAQVREVGGEPLPALLDVRDEGAFADYAALVQRNWGGLDVLINNAGVATAGQCMDEPLEQWQWVLDINLLGVVRGIRTLGALIRDGRSGHVVNIASFAGIAAAPGLASYGASKAAVVALSEQLRAELHAHGVGVTVVCPSFFTTNLMAGAKGASDKVKALVERWMQSSEVDADGIAAMIFDAVERGSFLLLPHRKTVWAWRLKRLFPERYFRQLVKMTQSRRL